MHYLTEPTLRVRHDCLDRFFRANSPKRQGCSINAVCPYCLMITNATHRYLLAKFVLTALVAKGSLNWPLFNIPALNYSEESKNDTLFQSMVFGKAL